MPNPHGGRTFREKQFLGSRFGKLRAYSPDAGREVGAREARYSFFIEGLPMVLQASLLCRCVRFIAPFVVYALIGLTRFGVYLVSRLSMSSYTRPPQTPVPTTLRGLRKRIWPEIHSWIVYVFQTDELLVRQCAMLRRLSPPMAWGMLISAQSTRGLVARRSQRLPPTPFHSCSGSLCTICSLTLRYFAFEFYRQ